MPRLKLAFSILSAAFLSLLPGSYSSAADPVIDLDAYQGQVVIVDFWASWCVPCRRSFPWFNAMQAKYGDDGLVIVGVNLDRQRSDAEAFLAEYPADFEIVYDADASMAREYGVQAMPSSIVFGRDGNVRERHMGFKVRQQDEYEAAIVAALEGSNDDP